MTFLPNRQSANNGRKLPKQPYPPTYSQIQALLNEAHRNPGRSSQLVFGNPPEEYSLTVVKRAVRGDAYWALYRGQGDSSMMVWDLNSSECSVIETVLTAQFPQINLSTVKLTAPSADSDTAATQHRAQAGQREIQSLSGHFLEKPAAEGDLKDIRPIVLIRTIAESTATGRLEIEKDEELATVCFTAGELIHSAYRSAEGDASFIEIIGMEEGHFRFYSDAVQTKKTIRKPLEKLLAEGAAINSQYLKLKQFGASEGAIVSTSIAGFSGTKREQFPASISDNDFELAERLYREIDGRTRLIDLARRFNLSKQQWVPIFHAFAVAGQVSFAKQTPRSIDNHEDTIDWPAMESAQSALLTNTTGFYTYDAWIYFLTEEFQRWERFGRPFSIMLLQLTLEEGTQKLPAAFGREVVQRINILKRKTDLLAHGENGEYVMLLLETDGRAANIFAKRVLQALAEHPQTYTFNSGRVFVQLGVSSIPTDCINLDLMVANARLLSTGSQVLEAITGNESQAPPRA